MILRTRSRSTCCAEQAHGGVTSMQGCVAYHGGAGSNSEDLAAKICPHLKPLPCASYEDAFLALTNSATDKALVPIEDSLGGSVQEVLDLFLRYVFLSALCIFATRTRSMIAGNAALSADCKFLMPELNSIRCLNIKELHYQNDITLAFIKHNTGLYERHAKSGADSHPPSTCWTFALLAGLKLLCQLLIWRSHSLHSLVYWLLHLAFTVLYLQV